MDIGQNLFQGIFDGIGGLIGNLIRTLSAIVQQALHGLFALPGPWLPVLVVGALILIGLALLRR